MTRPKNSTETFARYAHFILPEVEFSSDDRSTLEGICSAPDFVEWLQDLAAVYQGMKSHKTPTPGVVGDRLEEVAKHAEKMWVLLSSLDYITMGCLENTNAGTLKEIQEKEISIGAIGREINLLRLAANKALEKYVANKPATTASNAEASAATQLLTVFNSYGLPYSGYDFSDDHGKPGGPAAICLRIVLGKEKTARVGKWLRQAQKQAE